MFFGFTKVHQWCKTPVVQNCGVGSNFTQKGNFTKISKYGLSNVNCQLACKNVKLTMQTAKFT